mmetsp:Transcript_9097/g.27339  ORF Transcript_9097/g.27339 Transcript_9097/m.27339 type:complete len:212 (+) Transcript_9097:2731-3366(+)
MPGSTPFAFLHVTCSILKHTHHLRSLLSSCRPCPAALGPTRAARCAVIDGRAHHHDEGIQRCLLVERPFQGTLFRLIFGDICVTGRTQCAQVLQPTSSSAAKYWYNVISLPSIAGQCSLQQPIKKCLVAPLQEPGGVAGDEGAAGVQPAGGAALHRLQAPHQRVAVRPAGDAHAALHAEERPPNGAAAAGQPIPGLAPLPTEQVCSTVQLR